MKNLFKIIILFFIFATLITVFFFLIKQGSLQVLHPAGFIALQERDLIVSAVILMLSLAIPVLLVTFFVAWKYRASNKKATYQPEWTGNLFLKCLWWGILSVFVLIFWVVVWKGAHALDPYKSINSTVKPITIQVVALRWKWLFIYPKENIATVNFIQFPVHTPVNFFLTAGDSPMNSFWIPSLGGQIYAMTTMETKLHLLSDTIGDFPGGAAEINGSGFAGMRFTARVSSQSDFNAWVKKIKQTAKPLTNTTYTKLAKPSEDTPVMYFSNVDSNLYNTIMMQDMVPER